MGPSSSLRSSEDCTAESDPGIVAEIGRNFEDYMSAAIDVGSRAPKQTRSREVRSCCCSGILPVTVGQGRHIAADRMWPVLDIVVGLAAAVVEAPVGLGTLHFDLADTGHIALGSDRKEAAGSCRPGSKTLCRKCGCSRPSRGQARWMRGCARRQSCQQAEC